MTSTSRTSSEGGSIISGGPSFGKALFCAFLNVVVLPGMGTLATKEQKRRKTGWAQLGMGIVLIPVMVAFSMGITVIGGVDPQDALKWTGNLMLLLVLWNLGSSIGIVRDAWQRRRS